MKLFSFFLITFFSFAVFGQIEYKPVLDVDDYIEWKMKDNEGRIFRLDPFEDFAFDLPDTGIYVLSASFGEIEPMEIRVNYDHQIDTFFVPYLEIPAIISNPPPTHYRFHGKIAEGYCADYYKRGKLRSEGTFKNGHPIDTVKTYFYSGEIKELDIPIHGGKKYVDFYKNGNVEREYNSNNRTDKEYYSSGQLSLYRQYKKRRRTIEKEYYENGQLKRSQKKRKEVRYSSNGLKTDILRKKLVSGHFSRRYNVYDFIWKSYNFEGLIQSKISFKSYDNYPRYPKDKANIKRSNIQEAILFQKGKPAKKIVVKSEDVNKELVYRTTRLEKVNNKWVKKYTGTLHHLSEFL